jgi:hypothetical protein
MFQKSWVGVLLILAGTSVPAYGQAQMKFKWTKGSTFYLENVTDMKQTIEVMGQKIEQDMKNKSINSYKVLDITDEGVVLEQKIEAVKITATGPAAGKQEEIAEKMKGATFKMTISPAGKVTKFEGYDELIERIGAGNDAVKKLLKSVMNKETMSRSSEEAFGFLPDKPVNKGDQWKREMKLSMGPLGEFKVDNSFSYEGKEGSADKIGVTAIMSYTAPKEDAGGDLPFSVSKGDLKSEGAKGTIHFDAGTGKLVKYEMKLRIKGSLTIQVMGNMATMDLDQDQTTTIRAIDKLPAD